MHRGYIKLYRCIIESHWARIPEFVSLWVHCLTRANHKDTTIYTKGGIQVELKSGQFMTSRQQLSMQTGINESKIERILKAFKSEQQIEQVSFGKWRIISIVNWEKYQQSEQVFEQQTNSKRTANEQQMNTDKNDKNEKNVKEDIVPPSALLNLWNEIVKTPLASTLNKTREAKCRLRLKERTIQEWDKVFRIVVDSPFLRGDNDRGWRADFDWIIANDTNSLKVLEGKYSKAQQKKGGMTDDFKKAFLGEN